MYRPVEMRPQEQEQRLIISIAEGVDIPENFSERVAQLLPQQMGGQVTPMTGKRGFEFIIPNVPTWDPFGPGVLTPEDAKSHLESSNPIFRKHNITDVRWMASKERVMECFRKQERLMVCVTVNNKETAYRSLFYTNKRAIFLMGRRHLIFEPRPRKRTTICGNCLRNGHPVSTCVLPPRCARCAGAHNTPLCDAKCNDCMDFEYLIVSNSV